MEEDLDVQPVRDDPPQPPAPRIRRTAVDHDVDWCKKFGYGVGHFYNDLCASMWFTYLMIFLEKVLHFKSSHAGLLMLIGQATDAVSTPLVGIWSDSNVLPAFMDKIGRRMSWHVIGTICVTLTFPFIFNRCFICNDSGSEWYKVAWFIPFIMVFQFGWAAVQISHLALIPELSSLDASRTAMNSLRYAFTVIANLAVFVILAWLLSSDSMHDTIGPWDLVQFRTAAFMVVAAGLVVTFIFYAITREPQHQRRYSRLNSFSSDTSELTRMHWTSWFGHIQFYQVALLYMLARLYVNVSQVYFPFYITITEDYSKSYVAILPMVSYISSFLVSLIKIIPSVNNRINKKALLFVGIFVGLGTCAWMYTALDIISIYIVSAFMGVAQAILLITSLSLTADLINKNTESGAFVYGAMSFLDKLANGVAYQIIELFNPNCGTIKPGQICVNFYRDVMVFVPGACLILALIVLISLIPHSVGRRGRQRLEEDPDPIDPEEEPVAISA